MHESSRMKPTSTVILAELHNYTDTILVVMLLDVEALHE